MLGKKAQAETLMILIVVGMMLAAGLILLYGTIEQMPDDSVIGSSKAEVLTYIRAMDTMYGFFIFGIAIFGIVSAYYQRALKAFLPISIFTLTILIPLGGEIASIFLKMTSKAKYANAVANMPIVMFCQNNWPVILLGIGMVIIVAFMSKQE